MEFKSGIIVVKKGTKKVNDPAQILHFCGYEGDHKTPEEWKVSKDHLYAELRDDKELNFTWDLDDCHFVKCSEELLSCYNEDFKDIEG